MAQNLGLSVIAEGVEFAEQRDFLARHGCHTCQDYLFEQLEAFMLGAAPFGVPA